MLINTAYGPAVRTPRSRESRLIELHHYLRKPFPAQAWLAQHPMPPARAWLAAHPLQLPKPFPFPKAEPRPARKGLLARLAWLEDAIRQHSLHPYPPVYR